MPIFHFLLRERTVNPLHGGKKGFTLAEILIVTAIVLVLSIVVILNYRQQIARANDAKRKEDLSKLKTAFEDYYNDHSCYPSTDVWNACTCGSPCLAPQIPTFPCDPVTSEPYYYQTISDISGGQCGGYRAYAALEDTNDPDIKRVGCTPTGCGWDVPAKYNYGIAMGTTVGAPGLLATPTPNALQGLYNPGLWICNPQNSLCITKSTVAPDGRYCWEVLMQDWGCISFELGVSCDAACQGAQKSLYQCHYLDMCR